MEIQIVDQKKVTHYKVQGFRKEILVCGDEITYDGVTVPIECIAEMIKAFDYVSEIRQEDGYEVMRSVRKDLGDQYYLTAERGIFGDDPWQLHKVELMDKKAAWSILTFSAGSSANIPTTVEIFRELLKTLEKEKNANQM